jgi:predicted aspartyl protease
MSRIAPVATCLALLAYGAYAQAETTCLPPLAARLSARIIPDGGLVVDTTVEGIPAVMLVDTGTYYSRLTSRFAQAHDLPVRDSTGRIQTGSGETLHEGVEIREFKFGSLFAHNEWFLVSHDSVNAADTIDGVLGFGFMRTYDMEIDLAHGHINFFNKEHCPGKVVYWASSWFEQPITVSPGRKVTTNVLLNGTEVRTWIATGALKTTVQYQTAHDLFGLSFDDPGVTVDASQLSPEGKTLRSFTHNFADLAFGPITLHNLPMRVKEYAHFAQAHMGTQIRTTEHNGFPDLEIGMDVLSKLRLVLAYSDDKMYFTINDEKPAAPPSQ